MAKLRFDVGAEADILSPDEHKKHLMSLVVAEVYERARGVKPIRFTAQGTVASTAVVIPGGAVTGEQYYGSVPAIGPGDGYVWAIQRIAVYPLGGTADVIGIFRQAATAGGGSAFTIQPQSYLGQLTTTVPFWHPGSHGLLLLPDEQITLANIGALTTTGQLTVNGEAIEVPSEMVYKLL
jgi:hypothetical protein